RPAIFEEDSEVSDAGVEALRANHTTEQNSEQEGEEEETPSTSPMDIDTHHPPTADDDDVGMPLTKLSGNIAGSTKRLGLAKGAVLSDDGDEEDEEDAPKARPVGRRRGRTAVVVESDSD
ncbi:hypothetical protein LTR53_008208, partial [Teratosphaeriaceae sp. CCFEE 6253]